MFPRNYVFVEQETKATAPYGQPQQPQYGYPQGPPQQQNPYDANAPPMAVAEDGSSKHGEMGKKVGKKFGNAGKLPLVDNAQLHMGATTRFTTGHN